MGVTINNESTTTESPLRTDSSLLVYLWGAKIAFYWYQIFALDSAVVKSLHGGFLTIVMYHNGQSH